MDYHFQPNVACNMCSSSNLRVLGKRLNKSQGYNPHKKEGITVSVMKCNSCGLRFANPIPIPLKFEDHYNVEVDSYFEQTLKNYTENSFKEEIEYFKSNYPKLSPLRSLDIGAGLGRVMKSMEREGLLAYGIEPSKSFHQYAVDSMGIPKDRLRLATVENAEFENNFFDWITFSAVFEHLYDPNAALTKALSWLKPGGLIYIGVPNAYTLNQMIINTMYKIRRLDYVSNISPMHAPFHIYEFTRDSFAKNSKLNGYEVLNISGVTYKTYLPTIFDPILKPLIRLTKTDMNLMVWIRKI